MDIKEFKAILVLLVPLLVKEIISHENVDEVNAIDSLYQSQLYAKLNEEETKLWHFSPKALYQLYEQEKKNGHIDWPVEM